MFTKEGYLSKNGSLAIKGFAVLLMILHHTILRSDYFDTSAFYRLLGNLCRMCVPIFVFITGYGLFRQNCKTTQQVHKRLKSIWSGYFICFIFVLLFELTTGDIDFEHYSLLHVLSDITGTQVLLNKTYHGLLSEWWYISTAYALVIISPFWIPLVKKYKNLTIWLSVILPVVFHQNYHGVSLLLEWLPIYTIGMVCADQKPDLTRFAKHPVLYFILCGVAGILIYTICFIIKENLLFLRMWLPVVFILICIFCICQIQWIRKTLVFFGKYSYQMYCLHPMFLNKETIMNLEKYTLLTPFITSVILSLVVGIVLLNVLKTIKTMRELQKYSSQKS